MGIRETVNKNPGLAIGATIALIVVAVAVIVMQLRGRKVEAITDKCWFSSDDGKTWFKDSVANDSPFTKDGKEAVRAYVYKCPGGEPFVGYLERFSPEALELFAEQRKQPEPRVIRSIEAVGRPNVWVKKPGDKDWTKMSDDKPKRDRILQFMCPDNTTRPTMLY